MERREEGLSDEALTRILGRHRQTRNTESQSPPTDGDRWHQADRLFAEALEVPKNERAAFVDEACSGDPALRELVEELLAVDGALGSSNGELGPGAVKGGAEAIRMNQRIGPYRLVGQLGSGGLGTVYLAEQSEPIERKVALKLIKPGMDSEQVLARFEGERQALALMDHANVATVYDAGCTESGRPFIAMEYVPGHEITEHCDRAGLGFRDRIRLFLQVCDGVQHAHQKGLIHRDLKPSNILVKSSLNESATAKIIDFGVAKSLQRKLSSHAAHTQLGTFVGTPIYASPEQVLGRFGETDTRSDIYALGVVLYELLVGTPPHSLGEFAGKTQQEIARMLGEEPPSTPADRFSSSVEDTEGVAKRRSLSVEQMQSQLRGDISWILLKCLERRPEDRYPSVSELRQDLERWLTGLPLEARPATGFYRLGKLVRRHRTAVTVTVLVALTLLATTAAAVIGFARARQAAEEAELAADFQVEQLQELDPAAMGLTVRGQELEAIRQGLAAQGLEPAAIEAEVEKFEGLIRHANPTDLSLALLDEHLFQRAEAAIEQKYAETPRLQARLWQSVADTRRKLGQYEAAVTPQRKALEVRRRELGREHPLTLESLRKQGRLRLGMGRLDDAEADLRQAVQMHRRLLGDESLRTLYAISDLSETLMLQGQLDEAERLGREAHETGVKVLGEESSAALSFARVWCLALYDLGKLDEAEAQYRKILEIRRRTLGSKDPATLEVLNNLGLLLSGRGKLDEAERMLRETLELRREVLGDQHHHTLYSINNLAILFHSRGKLDEAEAHQREALETGRRVLGDRHLDTLTWMSNLGFLLSEAGRFDEAEPYLREALETRRQVLGGEHLHTLITTKVYSTVLIERSRYLEAFELMRDALPTAIEVLGEGHLLTAVIRSGLGEALIGLGEYEQAETHLVESLDAIKAAPQGFKSGKLRAARERLVSLYEAWDKPAKADEWRSKLAEPAESPG